MLKTFPSVGVVVFRGQQVLLIAKDNHPKHAYQLPGGQIEGGETPAEAASRELEETTGLASDPAKLVKIPTEWEAIIEKDYGTAVFPFSCFICLEYTGEIERTAVAAPKWVALDSLGSLLLAPNTQNAIEAANKQLAG